MKKLALPAALVALLAGAVLVSCSGGGANLFPNQPLALALGDPRPGLTQPELDAFNRGKLIFEKVFTPSDGLGPLYNTTSCRSCHSTPTSGGSSLRYRNFFIAVFGSSPTQGPLPGLPSIVIPAFGSGAHLLSQFQLDGPRHVIPGDVFGLPVTSGQRNAPPMFGVGLFETVTDATIVALSDPDDADGDGISGRFNSEFGGAIGRFGYKSQANNIEKFVRPPLQNQMGITTLPFRGSSGTVSLHARRFFQDVNDPDTPLVDNDGVSDPELSTADLGDLIAFTTFLAPPQKKPFTSSAVRGEALFDQVGCTACHMPSIPGSLGPVEAYTDLLLHDMGPGLDEAIDFGNPQAAMGQGTSTGREWRTAPLWGVSNTAPFLHDGRSETLFEAISEHGGEAQAARDAFLGLSGTERDDVISFLEAL